MTFILIIYVLVNMVRISQQKFQMTFTADLEIGAFSGHVCEQNLGKFYFFVATAPHTKMIRTIFWLL